MIEFRVSSVDLFIVPGFRGAISGCRGRDRHLFGCVL